LTVAQKIEAAEAASHAMPGLALPCSASPRQALPGHTLPRLTAPCSDVSVYHKKMSRVLAQMGSIYILDDLLTAIRERRMQSFAVRNSWAITQVQDFPRARQLKIIAMVGDLADGDALLEQIFDYADKVNASLVSAIGRMGWTPNARSHGWRVLAKNYVYQKDC
jgi:hypothetical protein